MRDILVVKCGGNAAVDPIAICADVAALRATGRSVLLVHGGSADIERLATRLDVSGRWLTSPDGITTRHTDAAMLEVITLALAGSVKPRLLVELAARGVPAIGLTGLDAGLLRAHRPTALPAMVDGRKVLIRDNLSGRITKVDTGVLHLLLSAGLTPVLSPPALETGGTPVNVNADRVAAAVAAAIGAEALVMLTGAPGVLTNPADESSAQPVYDLASADRSGAIGGMAIKLVAAGEALAGGVRRVVIGDGRRPAPVSAAVAGAGTVVVDSTAQVPRPLPDGGVRRR